MKMRHPYLGVIILLLTLNSFTANAQEAKTDTTVYTTVDVPATFPGGRDGWRRYLERNLEYPAEALKKRIEGVVRVQMVVSKDGYISGVKALNDPGGGLAEEAELLIREGPKWVPAELNEVNVKYRFVKEITFQLKQPKEKNR